MADLITGSTSYPASVDTATQLSNINDNIIAEHINGPNAAVVAIETELGTGLKGDLATLAARLNVNIDSDGGIIHSNSEPVSPPATPHFWYNDTTKVLSVYNVDLATYQPIATSVVLAGYVQIASANTITAQHTFNPGSAGPAFILGANAQDQFIDGLNADQVDGHHMDQNVNTGSTPTFANLTIADGGIIEVDSISEATTNNGVTIELTNLKDDDIVLADGGHIEVDTIIEATTDNGVDIEGVLCENSDLSANQLTSTVSTGTPPLVVSSTTTVANLKAANAVDSDTVDGFHASATPGNSIIPVGDSSGKIAFGALPAPSVLLTKNDIEQPIPSGVHTAVVLQTQVSDPLNMYTGVSDTFTVTIASPAVFTYSNHGFGEGTPIFFTTTGALPTGLTTDTVYYVKVIGPSTFKVSSTIGGADVNTTGTQSGTHTAYNGFHHFTIPAGVTQIRVTAQVRLAAAAGGTIREINVLKCDTGFGLGTYPVASATYPPTSAGDNVLNVVSGVMPVSTNERYMVTVYQDSGGSINAHSTSRFLSWICVEVLD